MDATEIRRRLSEADAHRYAAYRHWKQCEADYEQEVKAVQGECPHAEMTDLSWSYGRLSSCQACGAVVAVVSEL